MTTTCYEVIFSVGEISIKKDFMQNGENVVLNQWAYDGGGKYSYIAETMEEARTALIGKIAEVRTFLTEAEEKYIT